SCLGKRCAFSTFPPSRRLRDEPKGKSKPGISSYEWMRVWGQVKRTPGVILDYDERGDLVFMEILDASKRVTEARKMEFQVA
ncbi:MAG: DUF2283 domain-containing protein, partial [Candidatus Korobacteraceae bacterium]